MKVKLQSSLLLCFTFLFVGVLGVSAQKAMLQSVQKLQDEKKISDVLVNESRNTPFLLKMDGMTTKRTSVEDTKPFLREALKLNNLSTLRVVGKTHLSGGMTVEKFQRYHNGIKVEHGVYNVLSSNGSIQAISMEHYDIADDISKVASLSEDAALQQAFNHVGASEYAWDMYSTMKMNETDPAKLEAIDAAIESVYPTGELVYVDDYSTAEVDLRLAYKFNVYAAEPLYRADIYVDANDSKILLADMDIKHAEEINADIEESRRMSTFTLVQGSGDLRYAGTRNFETTFVQASGLDPDRYVLLGTIMVDAINPTTEVLETLPIENETKSYDGVGGAPISTGGAIPAYEITDGSSRPEEGQITVETADNIWSADEHWRDRFDGPGNTYPSNNETSNDDTGVDAHWGSEIVLRYWADRHQRYSWDGMGRRITSFVHYGDAYDNAFYTNGTMTYGDGSYQGGTNPNGSFAPLMSLDVAGHEIGHGVCDTTSDLVYARQSGGMNEGFSDVWAAAVEAYVIAEIDPSLAARYQPYGIGEQIDERDGGIQPEDNNPQMRALRFMDNPKAAGDPDCLEGANWVATDSPNCNLANDQCGVHTNSGVLNKWYYLLVEGSGQDYTPGRNKGTADDEENDNGQPYSVNGIGHLKAEKIAFGGEVLLTPNAEFSEMREMAILVAQNLFGLGSAEEEATTNAFFATCIGETYIAPEGNRVEFNTDNRGSLEERALTDGCSVATTYTYKISSVGVENSTTITIDASLSTATEGVDFDMTNATMQVEGSNIYEFDIIVYDDALIESNEKIILNFEFDSEIKTQNISLIDDDVLPTVGTSTIELLTEGFDTSEIPDAWETRDLVESAINRWAFNGTGTAAGTAYITDGTTTTPMYDGNGGADADGSSNALLISPPINALGLRDVNISFDFQVGGEDEVGNALDYGELVYTFDGSNFFSVETFVSETNSVNIGTYDAVLNDVDNSIFQLGFRWLNDQLLGTAFSFTVDNVNVTGEPALVETSAGTSVSNTMRTGDDVFFLTDQNNNIVARIENPSADLGCVALNVVSEGTDVVPNNAPSVNRSSKVITIEADGPNAATATYDLTLYFTAEELANFEDINALSIMKVEGNDITAANEANTAIAGGLEENFIETENYATFKGSFTGFSSFAISEDRVLGSNDFDLGTVSLYPSPVNAGSDVTITTKDLRITNASIFDVRGARVVSKDFDNVNNAQLSTAGLQSGFYFVRLNNDTNKTFKFIVK